MSNSKENQTSKVTDDQIVALYCQRDESAIVQTDLKYGGMLYTIAYNILYDAEDCEECKNDTYFGIWNAIPPSRPTVFSAFISKIMRNIAMARYRDKTRQKRIPSEYTISMEELQNIFSNTKNPEEEYEAKEVGKIISEYVEDLPERQRFIFMERFYFVKTIEQIAKECDVSGATIHREIGKIKEGLKAHLERNGVYL